MENITAYFDRSQLGKFQVVCTGWSPFGGSCHQQCGGQYGEYPVAIRSANEWLEKHGATFRIEFRGGLYHLGKLGVVAA